MAFKKKNNEHQDPKQKSWFKDKYQSVLVQRNILALFTLGSLAISLFAVLAVQNLAPLKSVEPFVIQIDEKSGITELVQPITRDTLTAPEQLDEYFLWRYIVARETHDNLDRQYRWNTVRVLSRPDVFTAFQQEVSPQNPLSPSAQLADAGTRRIENPTITFLADPERKIAQIRFAIRERFRNSEDIYYKLATVEYDYFKMELNRDERLINPLGFQIKGYRLDDEVVKR